VLVRRRPVLVDVAEGTVAPLVDDGAVGRRSCLEARTGDTVQVLGSADRDEVVAALAETGTLVVAAVGRDDCGRVVAVEEPGTPVDFGSLAQSGRYVFVPNHLTGRTLESVIGDDALRGLLSGRAIVVKRLRPLPIEAVVRGYLIGSGWRDYQSSGQVCGINLPKGLEQAAKLPQTLFTPATKAESGHHDENISFETASDLLGQRLAERVRDLAITIYERAAAYARDRDIIIADTKFEFGQDDEGRLYLIDEVLTPDSSRFWPANEYRTGISPPSFDKQFVRDYLDTLDWDKTAPGPSLPPDVIARTAEKYRRALVLMTGHG